MWTEMTNNREPVEHNGPITINEAMERITPDEEECSVLDGETYQIRRTNLILCSDHQNGYFFTNVKTSEKYYTLEDLRNAGIQAVSIKMEFTLETEKKIEEIFRA